jgi:hypothetical protein
MSDMSGHDASQSDTLHTLTLRDLEARVAAAGVLICHRQLMRHCEAGTFDAKKLPATNNVLEWFIAPASVDKGIADIKTLQEQRARRDASRRDMTQHVGIENPTPTDTDMPGHDASRPSASEQELQDGLQSDTPSHVPSRPDVTEQHPSQRGSETEPVMSGYVAQLEKRIEEKDDVIGMLRGELAQRNEEIVRRNERERETNILIRGLQNLVLQLQPGRERTADVLEDDPAITKREGEQTTA